MNNAQPNRLLTRFFSGMTEYTFHVRMGVPDTKLVDYISDLLVRFVWLEKIYSVRTLRGKRITEVARMLTESQHRKGAAKGEIQRQIGDITLFWAGLYPDALPKLQGKNRADYLLDYKKEGQRAYLQASRIPTTKNKEGKETQKVLRRLGEQFEMCLFGLGEIRREWENRDENSGGPQLLLE
ncbi:MAG: hypothetical protein MPJ24_05915 [Pirellulaceae bacterium]|nr:hypothetical protein [Pirellulaceae bacterium]